MLNVMITETRLIAVRQKKTAAGAEAHYVCSVPRMPGETGCAAAAAALRAKLQKAGEKEKRAVLILTGDVVFKEFTHLPVSAKAVMGFARLEARTVLRDEADKYSISYMDYHGSINEKGEETGMLLATAHSTLAQVKKAFSAAGFSVESVQSTFNCYVSVLAKLLAQSKPEFSGAAIDYGYEDTLLAVYNAGQLVSLRRLPGLRNAFAPVVKEVTGCEDSAVDDYLYGGEYSAAYLQRACEALDNYNYDILRAVRVASVPLHFEVESFYISGEVCTEQAFCAGMQSTLALPCTFAGQGDAAVEEMVSKEADAPRLVLIAGAQYTGGFNLLNEQKKRRLASLKNTSSCALLTGLVVVGMLVWPVSLMVQRIDLGSVRQRHQQLQTVQNQLDELAIAKALNTGINAKLETLQNYTGNTADTLADTLALFGDGLTVGQVAFDGVTGAYSVTFYARDDAAFTALKNKIYANEAYYLNLSLTSTLQANGSDVFAGTYECLLQFVPLTQKQLPANAVAETDAVTAEESADALLAAVGEG